MNDTEILKLHRKYTDSEIVDLAYQRVKELEQKVGEYKSEVEHYKSEAKNYEKQT